MYGWRLDWASERAIIVTNISQSFHKGFDNISHVPPARELKISLFKFNSFLKDNEQIRWVEQKTQLIIWRYMSAVASQFMGNSTVYLSASGYKQRKY